MRYQDKKHLFLKFLDDWEIQFRKVPHILRNILSYPEIVDKLCDFEPIQIECLGESQLEWISLVAQFDNPIESSFFKDYWVPIQKNSYDYFIDISSEKYSLFEVHYFFFEPYRWYKEFIIDDVISFLSNVDNENFNISEYLERHKKESWAKVQGYFKERKELGLGD